MSDETSQEPAQGRFDKWIPWLMWWNTDEWWPCWIGLLFFGCITAAVNHQIPSPSFLLWDSNPFSTFTTVGNYGLIVLFFAMGLLVWLALAATKAPSFQLFPYGYFLIFTVALISKILAHNVTLKKASLGDSIWAILLGCVVRNVLSFFTKSHALPPWLKVAQLTELYIAISLVLLCIDVSVLRPLAPRALFVSWIDTPTLFMAVAFIGWRFLKIDRQTAIIMSGATFICGSSAAIALGSSMGVIQKTEMPIAIISIFTIPSLIALPYVAKELSLGAAVSGAWFGGCIDSTGAVIAAANIYGDVEAINTAAVVKMMQNILIGPIAVAMAWGWSRYELQAAYKEEEELIGAKDADSIGYGSHSSSSMNAKYPVPEKRVTKEKAYVMLWKRFPKFVIGFILTAVLFNTVIDAKDTEIRSEVNTFCFYVAEWYSTMSFVTIGLGLQLNELKNNIGSLGKLVTLYVLAQMVDIVATCVLAWVAFTYF